MLTDPNIQEWGHPVLIEKPEGLNLRPGELVDVELIDKPQELNPRPDELVDVEF